MEKPGLEPRPPAPGHWATAPLYPLAPLLLPSEFKRNLLHSRPRRWGCIIPLPDGQSNISPWLPTQTPASHGSLCPIVPPPVHYLLLQSDSKRPRSRSTLSLLSLPHDPSPHLIFQSHFKLGLPGDLSGHKECPFQSSTFLNECFPPLALLTSQEGQLSFCNTPLIFTSALQSVLGGAAVHGFRTYPPLEIIWLEN